MRDRSLARRAARGAVILTSLTGFVGCAPPIVLPSSFATPSGPVSFAVEEPATVQLRYFSFSPMVAVVAWPADDAGYGLRTSVRRDGSLVRDHRLYVGTLYEPWVRALRFAVVPPVKLEFTGVSRDSYACYFGACTPFETISVRVPDELLRGVRDSVSVAFHGWGGRQLTITMRRDLIDKYLATVDSVSASLRRQMRLVRRPSN